ncbi:MAG: hypothetical protein RSB04_12660 [Gordonibacter sp.]|uniref:type IV toxin-antitoxin system AbiEi family antitoxin n=1 Tax=Gordonibacter sp. TaxID=1968902 RepID=UPI002FC5AD03
MKSNETHQLLSHWDRKGRYVYTKADLAKLINDPSDNTLSETLRRLVANGTLVRAARGVYVYANSRHLGSSTIEDVALALRRGEYVFESLESALSLWGDISQIPLDRITLMTTGRKGEYRTPFGVIEFTHTQSSPATILDNTVQRPDHPIPLATKEFARANLKQVRRNLSLLAQEGAAS